MVSYIHTPKNQYTSTMEHIFPVVAFFGVLALLALAIPLGKIWRSQNRQSRKTQCELSHESSFGVGAAAGSAGWHNLCLTLHESTEQ
jgi:hypothetical protein